MSLFWNRIGFSLLVIVVLLFLWEFWVRPVSGPIYLEAVHEYRQGDYLQARRLLQHAYAIDPNNTDILTLMGWNELKLNHPRHANRIFSRAHQLSPHASDATLGYAYAQIALHHLRRAEALLNQLRRQGVRSVDTHLAWGVVDRKEGRNRAAAREFEAALAQHPNDPLALKNLRQLYDVTEAQLSRVRFEPLRRAARLTYTSRVQGEDFARNQGGAWKPSYWTGVDLTAALPGQFPVQSARRASVYAGWLEQISALGVNTVRVSTIMPPSFYRALVEFDSDPSHPPLWLLQGITFPRPPLNYDLFNQVIDLVPVGSAGVLGVELVDDQPQIEETFIGVSIERHQVSRRIPAVPQRPRWLCRGLGIERRKVLPSRRPALEEMRRRSVRVRRHQAVILRGVHEIRPQRLIGRRGFIIAGNP